MNKLAAAILSLSLSFTSFHFADKMEQKEQEQNNVGNGEEYSYIITDVIGNEVHGLPLDKESDDNKGIFLYEEELTFEVAVGDKIVVVWGEYEDEFKSIEKLN